MISGDRKKSPIVCNHKAHIPFELWRGCPSFLRNPLFSPPLRLAEYQPGGSGIGISRRCLRRNRPFLPVPGEDRLQITIKKLGHDPNPFHFDQDSRIVKENLWPAIGQASPGIQRESPDPGRKKSLSKRRAAMNRFASQARWVLCIMEGIS